jgi:two-component system chemotaxis response regulator CheB
MPGHDIIVIGASAGGLEALSEISRDLPRDLPAAIFVVWHISPESRGLLPTILQRVTRLPVAIALDQEPIKPGHIYVAPPDYHLLLDDSQIRLSRGPKENRFRPAVDPLFRSAALTYGPRVIGVILSGGLDDGTAGLWAIKTRGGITVVQDPQDAIVTSMPESALANVKVDHCLPVNEIAPLLVELAQVKAANAEDFPTPIGLQKETRIAMEANTSPSDVLALGEPSIYACPECHGTLLRMKDQGPIRFRCHTGHAYTLKSLLSEVNEKVESTLWNAVRAIEENSLLLDHLSHHLDQAGNGHDGEQLKRQAARERSRAQSVRQAIFDSAQKVPPTVFDN